MSKRRGGVGWIDGVGLGLIENNHGHGCWMRVGGGR